MIRTIAMLVFWALAAPVAALIGFPWTFITGDIRLLYRMFMWWRVERRPAHRRARPNRRARQTRSRRALTSSCRITCRISIHPFTIPLIPRRTSVMVKKEFFKVPILGRAMRMGSLVPVDRGNRDAGIEAVRRRSKSCSRD